jgi:hypothetical protein
LGEKESNESTLQQHQHQMRDLLNTKVAELKQYATIVDKLKAEKQEQEGETQACSQVDSQQACCMHSACRVCFAACCWGHPPLGSRM